MELRRRVLAIAWLALVGSAVTSWLAGQPLVLFGLWFAALMLLAMSSVVARPSTDERLELPLAYRTAAAVAFALPLAGELLTQVPHASG